MRRFFLAAAVAVAFALLAEPVQAGRQNEIIPEPVAKRHGLTRPWHAQIQLDRTRARVHDILLYDGVLYVQTNRAKVHAIDAETGETLWVRRVGRENHPSMTPGANKFLLAVINGSRLYVCNRATGNLLFEVEVDGAPGAGPALSDQRAYIPMVNGLMMAYRLTPTTDPLAELGKRKKDAAPEAVSAAVEEFRRNIRLRQQYIPPLSCQSLGRTLVQPLVTRQTAAMEYVVWPTDRGDLNIGLIDRREDDVFAVKFRLTTGAEISARPTYMPPDPKIETDSGIIFAVSKNGYVHAVHENNGESLWRFPTGEPILQPAVVVGDYVYVATQLGGLYCLEAKTGSEMWWTPNVKQFISASEKRIYATDKLGNILILDRPSGARLDTLRAEQLPIKLINADSDRLYLASDTGRLQCLHEIELTEPLNHHAAPPEEAQPEEPAEDAPAEEGEDPFAEDDENPFE